MTRTKEYVMSLRILVYVSFQLFFFKECKLHTHWQRKENKSFKLRGCGVRNDQVKGVNQREDNLARGCIIDQWVRKDLAEKRLERMRIFMKYFAH